MNAEVSSNHSNCHWRTITNSAVVIADDCSYPHIVSKIMSKVNLTQPFFIHRKNEIKSRANLIHSGWFIR